MQSALTIKLRPARECELHSLEVVKPRSVVEPIASPNGPKLWSDFTFPLVLIGNAFWGDWEVMMSEIPFVKLLIPAVTSERGLSVVVTSMWLKIPTKGDVVASTNDDVDLDDVTEKDDKGIAALVETAAVGWGKVFVVIIIDVVAAVEVLAAVVVAARARARGGNGVRFLAGGWMVGVEGLN